MASVGITSHDTNTALKQFSDRLSELPGPAEKNALAFKALGRNGTDMVRVFGVGSEALKKFGSGFTGEFAKQADAFNDSLGQIKRKRKRCLGCSDWTDAPFSSFDYGRF
jgi:hypothetical protein